MKKFFMAASLSLCAIVCTYTLSAQNPDPISTCFVDNYGCVYHLSIYPGDKKGCHTTIGVVTMKGDDGDEMCWAVIGNGCFVNSGSEQNGDVHFVAYNPARDNCATDVDSIVYDGQLKWERKTGTISGGGTLAKYCGGNVVASGSWTATGPCDDDDKKVQSSKGANNNFSFSVLPNPANTSAVIQYTLTKTSTVGVAIYNFNNQLVKVMAAKTQPAGQNSASWNLADASGRKASPGLYKVVITVDGNQYSQTIQVL